MGVVADRADRLIQRRFGKKPAPQAGPVMPSEENKFVQKAQTQMKTMLGELARRRRRLLKLREGL